MGKSHVLGILIEMRRSELLLQIKGWSRKKKEALIKKDWKSLSICAKRRKGFG